MSGLPTVTPVWRMIEPILLEFLAYPQHLHALFALVILSGYEGSRSTGLKHLPSNYGSGPIRGRPRARRGAGTGRTESVVRAKSPSISADSAMDGTGEAKLVACLTCAPPASVLGRGSCCAVALSIPTIG